MIARRSGGWGKDMATASKKKGSAQDGADSRHIDAKIKELGDWRGDTLARLRALIHAADPEVVEQVKWRKPSNPRGVPVWEHDGIICTGETYKDKVKLTFARGASIPDASGLFNSSLDAGARRAIDLHEDDKINDKAFKALIRAAVALNIELAATPSRTKLSRK